MLSRSCSVVAAALLLAALTGCTGSGQAPPSPSPTGFASEEEAFAAAEETYRDYTARLNAYFAGDRSYEPSQYLSGSALKEEEAVLASIREQEATVDGQTVIRSFEHVEATSVEHAWSVTLVACLDYSGTRILDAVGEDITPPRDELVPLRVRVATMGGDDLKIVKSEVIGEPTCA
ncbi:hypothetical protein [Microbacterium sp. NPDC096154]|uniref:hypothetical protein n=1 Tax=Microbacterium sp. NPDC096154 TaxID=3155549 RepID=UPI0033301C8A